ncbi:MAG: CpaF family protein [Chloroflexota bacterium]|nr:CpaF family protein [Chloroflexota bacterium]
MMAVVRPTTDQAAVELNEEQYARLNQWACDQIQNMPTLSHVGITSQAFHWVEEELAPLLRQAGVTLTDADRQRLVEEVADDVVGYGPIGPLIRDPTVTEVMVNGPHLIYVERDGKLVEADVRFEDEAHVKQIIQRIIQPLGRRVDRSRPMVDARLPDGSRVNVIISPCALDGSVLTIRKFPSKRLTIEELIRLGTLSEQVAEFVHACVLARLNVVVSGGTGSGKTTLLNVLSSFIPSDERIVTIEDSAELQLHQRHVVRLETAPAEPDGTGQVSIRDLVINALRMRPDRIVVGEVRGGEALDMLQAMNTGHDGSLTTVHANTPRDAISRLETLVLMSGFDLPLKVARAQIASAIDLIIQQERMRDGSRKITRVTEVQGMEGDIVVLQDVFIFQAQALSEEGDRVEGEIKPTGIRPNFVPRLEAAGAELPPAIFVDPSGVAGRLMRESDNIKSHRRSRH